MKRIIQYIIRILSVFSVIIGILFGAEWIKRLSLPYNSGGRYFDQATEIVYIDSGIVSYGMLTFLFLIIGFTFLFLTLKLLRR